MDNVSLQQEVENYVRVQRIRKKDFAQQIGVTPQMLSHWLKGRILFDKDKLYKINRILSP